MRRKVFNCHYSALDTVPLPLSSPPALQRAAVTRANFQPRITWLPCLAVQAFGGPVRSPPLMAVAALTKGSVTRLSLRRLAASRGIGSRLSPQSAPEAHLVFVSEPANLSGVVVRTGAPENSTHQQPRPLCGLALAAMGTVFKPTHCSTNARSANAGRLLHVYETKLRLTQQLCRVAFTARITVFSSG